jgi:hypothetical protein
VSGTTPGGPGGGEGPKGIAAAITEVSERASLLLREEIELAKAEVIAKATKLARGAVIGVAAGIFLVTALFFFLIGCAWLLYYYLPIGNDYTYFYGFFAMAVILVALGVIAGLIAARVVKRGSPPTPDMAIEEARLIRETVSSSAPGVPASAVLAPGHSAAESSVAAAAAAGSVPAPYGAAAPHTPSSPTGPGAEGAA